MGRCWKRTAEQQHFMDLMVPNYYHAQVEGKGATYTLFVIEEWFKRWPERGQLPSVANSLPLTEEEKALQKRSVASAVAKKKKQLANYLLWHVDKLKTSGGRASRAKTEVSLKKYLKEGAKKRKIQAALVFGKLFGKKIDAQLNLMMPPLPDDATPPDVKSYHSRKLGARTKLMYAMWDASDDETRKIVHAAKEKMDRDAGLCEEDDEDDDDDDEEMEGVEGQKSAQCLSKGAGKARITAEMQKDIDLLGKMVVSLVKRLARKTGWSFTVLMGGLNEQGIPDSASVNVGTTPTTGLNFAEYVVDFDSKILHPFREFLSAAYPQELRQACAAEYAMKVATAANMSVAPVSEPLETKGTGAEYTKVMDNTSEFNFGSVDDMDCDSSFGSIDGSQANHFTILDDFMAEAEDTYNSQRDASDDVDDALLDLMPADWGLESTYQPQNLIAPFPGEGGVISDPLAENSGLRSTGMPIFPSVIPPSLFGHMLPLPLRDGVPDLTGPIGDQALLETGSIPNPYPTAEPNANTRLAEDDPLNPTPGAVKNLRKKPAKKKPTGTPKVKKQGKGSGSAADQINTGDQIKTRSIEEAERDLPNVNVSGRPIRERKKKEPMGAVYEREVEKWTKKKARK